MASGIYLKATQNIAKGNIDFDTHTFKVALLTSTYAIDETKLDTHEFYSNLTNEVSSSGTGYTTGGNTATITVNAEDTTNDWTPITLGGTSWSTSTITARYAVYYRDTGTGSTSPLVCIIDFGTDVTSTNGTFTLTASTLRLTA